jgi:aerobic-type carbon monoxide dehydrogenase small subunit (CoxS/CutS family)
MVRKKSGIPGRRAGRKRSPPDEITRGPGKVPIRLRVNGSDYALEVEPRCTLLDALRSELHWTGTKKVCDMGECGACTVIMDGKAVYSCLALAVECEGREILTIEGLSDGRRLDPIQESFIEHDGFQCGFCTPGQIMSVRALLMQESNPSRQEIRQSLSGNLCRCGAYTRILSAAEAAAAAYAGRTGKK